MRVKIRKLHTVMRKVLTTKHLSLSQAKEIAEVLLYAELSGKNTQGIIKFWGTEPVQDMVPQHEPKVIKETKLSTLIDGGRNSGILVSRIATKTVIKKCKDSGFAIVGTNNVYASSGALGFYANEIAQHDFIGIVMSGTPKGVAPYGSIDKLVGINPIAFGFPTLSEPLILDMATAAITWYGLVRAKIMGVKLPDDVAIDHEGNATNDPEKAMKGAIRTFGKDYKGSGLNLIIEMFTGPLVGAMSPAPDGKWYNGALFIAIDPDLLIGKENLKKNSSLVINKIKSSRVNNDFQEIVMPGEKALRARKKAESSGEIEIEDTLYADLLKLIGNR